jgi:nucleoside-diphosphate-sugar epimerase
MAFASGTAVRIARFHNIYGPECAWIGGREKAPAALCRKVATAKLNGDRRVEIWGDGKQTRSFCHISDCLEMLHRLMRSDYSEPLNIGTNTAISIDDLTDIIAEAAGIEIEKVHVTGIQGVRGRNANLAMMRQVLDYKPKVQLEEGMGELYRWVKAQVSG